MSQNNARSRAARQYMQSNPGTKYTEALRAVDAQENALLSSPFHSSTEDTVLEACSRPFFEKVPHLFTNHRGVYQVTNIVAAPGAGKSVAVADYLEKTSGPVRVAVFPHEDYYGLDDWLSGSHGPRSAKEFMEMTHKARRRTLREHAQNGETLVVSSCEEHPAAYMALGEVLLSQAPENVIEVVLEGRGTKSNDAASMLFQHLFRLSRSKQITVHAVIVSHKPLKDLGSIYTPPKALDDMPAQYIAGWVASPKESDDLCRLMSLPEGLNPQDTPRGTFIVPDGRLVACRPSQDLINAITRS